VAFARCVLSVRCPDQGGSRSSGLYARGVHGYRRRLTNTTRTPPLRRIRGYLLPHAKRIAVRPLPAPPSSLPSVEAGFLWPLTLSASTIRVHEADIDRNMRRCFGVYSRSLATHRRHEFGWGRYAGSAARAGRWHSVGRHCVPASLLYQVREGKSVRNNDGAETAQSAVKAMLRADFAPGWPAMSRRQ